MVPVESNRPKHSPKYTDDDRAFELVVIGPAIFKSWMLKEGQRLEIGRMSVCEICLDVDTISRRHARLYVEPGPQFFIEDLGSSNGTVVNHQRIAAHTKVAVRVGVAMDFGELTALIRPCPADAALKPLTADTAAIPPGAFVVTGHMLDGDEVVLKRLASSHLSILILGESGVGKEELANRLVAWSPRYNKPFEKLNCGAVQDTLLESELFGHEKGAFTDARAQKRGRFELADQGTLFLDEIGELSPAAQVKLLRFLENREFSRVGGVEKRKVDVRVIAATHSNVCPPASYRGFREDLYYRLAGVVLYIPPLRQRRDEIVPLSERFAAALCKKEGQPHPPQLSPDACAALAAYDWPGNIRELRNTIERAIVLCSGSTIEAEDLRLPVRPPQKPAPKREHSPTVSIPSARGAIPIADDDETDPRGRPRLPPDRQSLERALERYRWNRGLVAQHFEVSRGTLYKWLRLHGLMAGMNNSMAGEAELEGAED